MVKSPVKLPPGPAFIPCASDAPPWLWHPGRVIPPGYLWSPATDSTMAGWVRPMGTPDA